MRSRPGTGIIDATVIVLSYQGRQRIGRVLEALRLQDSDAAYEVIVVDSGSDRCDTYVGEQHPEVTLIHSSSRLRPGPARNRGG
jgi:glycosyltransferase involved in cell wall biosynthesis